MYFQLRIFSTYSDFIGMLTSSYVEAPLQIIKKLREAAEKREHLYTLGGNVN